MEKVRNLMKLNSNGMRIYLDTFDTIITDCDGVLWFGNTPVEKSFQALKKLESFGKKIIFVSNNSTMTLKEYCERFQRMGYSANPDQIAIPSNAICWYLKKLKFDGKAFVLGANPFCQVLKDGGINIVEPCPDRVEENQRIVLEEYRKHSDVNAVIMDLDINVNWLKISKSIRYLKNPDVLYLTAGVDRQIPISSEMSILGFGAFVDLVSKETNREPVKCAKPSKIMKDYVIEKFKLDDPSRCLFIGDSFETDMKFADFCGFGKLWVGSGVDRLESMTSDQQRYINENCSSFIDYAPSLGHLVNILGN